MRRTTPKTATLKTPQSALQTPAAFDPERFHLKNKIVFLRLFRLRHMPSAFYSAQLLAEQNLPVLAVEFGNAVELVPFINEVVPRIRIDNAWTRHLPKRLWGMAVFFSTFIKLSKQILREGKPELIVAHGIQEQWMAYLLNFVFDIPYVVHVHEVYDEHDTLSPFNRFLLSQEKRALNGAEFLIFPEEGRSETYSLRYHLENQRFIAYNCPRLRKKGKKVDLRKRHNIPATGVLLVYIGGVGEINAIREVVSALKTLPSVYFLIVGWQNQSYLEKLKADIKRLALQKRVIFVGEVEDKWEYLDNSTISYCVYRPTTLRTRLLATASNKLTESMAAGLPVITTANADFKQIVTDYEIGVCVKSISAANIQTAIKSLVSDSLRLKRFSRNGLRCHQNVFNYETQYKIILEELRKINNAA